MVYNDAKTNKNKLLKYWLNFYHEQSCGQCTACREGTYRLWEMANAAEPDRKLFKALLENLADSRFCALAIPIGGEQLF